MNALSYERRQQLVEAAHRRRNEEIGRLLRRLVARLMAQPRLRESRWISPQRAG